MTLFNAVVVTHAVRCCPAIPGLCRGIETVVEDMDDADVSCEMKTLASRITLSAIVCMFSDVRSLLS